MSERITEHYRNLLKEHGDSAESAQYSSRESQERRYVHLIRIGKLEGCKILDFGCGTAHLATFLQDHGIDCSYTGVDVVSDFLTVAKNKHPGHRFGVLNDFAGEHFDYIFVSGVFNNKRRDNRKFYQENVEKLFSICKQGLAFNMMSTYVEYKDSNLFYEKPETAFRFVKEKITPFVNLIHDYEVKPGIIPFEFVIHAYRNPFP